MEDVPLFTYDKYEEHILGKNPDANVAKIREDFEAHIETQHKNPKQMYYKDGKPCLKMDTLGNYCKDSW